MSGNVSEIPAFTERVLFVDQPGYLTTPHPSFPARTRLARALIRGEPGDPGDRGEIDRLARPVYLISTAPERLAALERLHGPARFTAAPARVFVLTTGGALPGSAR